MAEAPSRSRALVIQSHPKVSPAPWIDRCTATVKAWATDNRYTYRLLGDEIFAPIQPTLRAKLANRKATLADLGRLYALQAGLDEGFDPVLWLDADFLVFDPGALTLPGNAYALGREVWIDRVNDTLKVYRKVHNAYLMFRRDNPFLAFYLHAAERILSRHRGDPVPQIVGPKLLSTLHSLLDCPVAERAGALSPAVLTDIASGGGAALAKFIEEGGGQTAGANLCLSMVSAGAIDSQTVNAAIDRLLSQDTGLPVQVFR